MCGIIGYTGRRCASDVIVSGLQRLEYRGYDSAGIAVLDRSSGELLVSKTVGKVGDLERCMKTELPGDVCLKAVLGIGHTRWATHGPPTRENAHPHMSRNGTFAVVHNGIIDNYAELRARLVRRGYSFASETDTEVIAHLIEECYEGDLRGAVAASLEQLSGTYGIAVVSSHHPDVLVAARKGSPIVVGVCDDEVVVASDVSAIINYTDRVIFLDDGDILTATPERIELSSVHNVPVEREMTHIDWDIGQIEKGGYAHYMLKEIHEQPVALGNTIRGRLLEEDGTTKLSGMQMDPREMARIGRIVIAACGTSYYAGMVGKYLFEDLAGIPCDIE